GWSARTSWPASATPSTRRCAPGRSWPTTGCSPSASRGCRPRARSAGSPRPERIGAAARQRSVQVGGRGPQAEQRVLLLGGEHVQPEADRDLPAHVHAPDAVAVLVEPGGVDPDPELARDGDEQTTADAALGGDADLEGPLA